VDLAQRVSVECGIDQEQARTGLGTLFTAVRMAINANEHKLLTEAFPDLDGWLEQGMMSGGRTGEMLALIGTEALEKNLRSTGLEDAQIAKLAKIVGGALHQSVPEIGAKVTSRLPLIAP